MGIHKGIVRGYEAGTGLVSVELVGSHPSFVQVPAGAHLGAVNLVDGRRCAVVFFDESNARDGLVVATYDVVADAHHTTHESGGADEISVAGLAGQLAEAQTPQDWTAAGETWTYASATTVTVAGDVTGKYAVGDKVRLKQGGAYKYFYVVSATYSAPNTTLTLYAGSDYTVANAAITDQAYSKLATPQGFPHWFYYTPTWTSGSNPQPASPGLLRGRFTLNGRLLSFEFVLVYGPSTTAGTGQWIFQLPWSMAASAWSYDWAYNFRAQIIDAGTGYYSPGLWGYPASAATIYVMFNNSFGVGGNLLQATVPMTWANGDVLHVSGEYEV